MRVADTSHSLKRYLERFAEPLAALHLAASRSEHKGENNKENNADSTDQVATNLDALNAKRIDACRSGSYRWVLVVPAFDEPADFAATLVRNLRFADQSRALLVIQVINAPTDATPDQRSRTLKALPAPERIAPEELGAGIHLLTLDAATVPLPADQATGLARKLGNDVACRLLFEGHIKSALLCNSDADAILPANYFRRLATTGESSATDNSAWILPFRHQGATPELAAAGASYELYLRSLYINLAHCGSPYAYPALGSVLAIDAVLYAKSRGFPKRRAGEDFYLLNKLAKLGQINYLAGAPVLLAARTSPRVPFGTGPAISTAIAASQDSASIDVSTYSLTSFALLKQFYSGFAELRPDSGQRRQAQGSGANRLPVAWRDPDLVWLLKRLGVPRALSQLQRNHTTVAGLQRGLHEWFDALKTVRFLNEARHFSADEPLSGQFAHLAKLAGLSADTPPPATATVFNRELELNRTVSRHSVALMLE